MFKQLATALICVGVPTAILAEPVELRSSDGFISVDGEIVGFDGAMLSVLTSVGVVSVPASEVICLGEGCVEVLESNDFGLTVDAFQGVDRGDGQVFTAPQVARDRLIVAFSDPLFDQLFRTVAGAMSVAPDSEVGVDSTSPGEITLRSSDESEIATLLFDGAADTGDIEIDTVSLLGSAAAVHSGPASWSSAGSPDYQLVGLKAFAVVVNPDLVGVGSISLEDLARVYAGEISNWSELGGPDVNVLPLQLPPDTLVRNELISLVMEPAGKEIAPSVLTMADEASIASSINSFPGSISMVSIADAGDNIALSVAGSCGVAVPVTEFGIISGDYQLIRPVMASYAEVPRTSLPVQLFDWASKPGSLSLVEGAGFFNQSAQLQNGPDKNVRISQILSGNLDDASRPVAAQMFEILFEADRLSATMYGGPTSGPEGGWNRSMFVNLRDVLSGSEFSGKDVIFVGFGDSSQGSQAAIDASAEASADMQAAFANFAGDVIGQNGLQLSSYGFGSVAPATCYGGQVTTDTYTRIEVWVR